MLLTQK